MIDIPDKLIYICMVKTTLCLFKREKRKFNGTKGRLKEAIHCSSNYLGRFVNCFFDYVTKYQSIST